jgi:hypothetical protein
MQVDSHAAQVAQAMQQRQSPAKLARERIGENPDLAASLFGKLVSEIAKSNAVQAQSDT